MLDGQKILIAFVPASYPRVLVKVNNKTSAVMLTNNIPYTCIISSKQGQLMWGWSQNKNNDLSWQCVGRTETDVIS
jgi:hypothetical protein